MVEAFQKNEGRKQLFYKNLLIFFNDFIIEGNQDYLAHLIAIIEYQK